MKHVPMKGMNWIAVLIRMSDQDVSDRTDLRDEIDKG